MTSHPLEDIAAAPATHSVPLDWVGMEGIALPLQVAGKTIAGRASAGVSLDDPAVRGIHMSRLYLALAELEDVPLTLPRVNDVLNNFLDSHQQLSQQAYLDLEGEALLRRPALISPLSGWKTYPFALRMRRSASDQVSAVLDVSIGYSSTCPCSAALARQLIQQAFDEDFTDTPVTREAVHAWLASEQGILATPHSQRSQAHLSLSLSTELTELPLETIVDRVEKALGTALQTAVKRVDEQAFALANGQNLMFCEDAARRVHQVLRDQPGIDGFYLKVVHAESLHAHDAVARSQWNWREEA
ncbi:MULTISPECIES: GTP cyclohydrolase FolE2 [unclassified Halomonas]|uniref:GTP cyclohydrolase FolE2 n=1 Tax=unclassified Halomonas TaxID=2609666 RepID=UPI001C963BEB|nr:MULTISPECIES: GTP cyclohydrolase FolE2 [unclassified Halomonas]MBY5924074.1 GTP cyclohydrolase FolE2 [Halomonas sp. DP4Y7-2]MBY6231116.1 GTP cyclohydrolase FolE2 [Halomonas sp. DP4Y7-1]